MGLEIAFTGQQYLSTGIKVRDHWTVGFSAVTVIL
jgi:hypothetical protein